MDKLFDPSSMVEEQLEWFEQAKAMEKKQCVDFALKCMFAHVIPSQATREVIEKLFDEYYNETFKNESTD